MEGGLMWDVVRNCGESTPFEVGQERSIGHFFIPLCFQFKMVAA
jgi:hypothetical protein